MLNRYIKKGVKKLANLQLAIGLLALISLIIGIGTIIEQDQPLTFYKENYPLTNPLFGVLTWKIILFFNFNQVYTSWWFLVILLLFGCSLLACTFTTQLPSLKNFKLWKFYTQRTQFQGLGTLQNLNLGYFNALSYQCNMKKYHFFRQQKKGYAYSGLLGRVAPIVVHMSIIILLIGSTIGSFGGFTAQQLVPRGEVTHIQNLITFGKFSAIPQDLSIRVNDFWITYTKDLKTDQFYSDLSVLNPQGKEIKRKTVFVNEPLVSDQVVLYQTDWDIVGLKLRLANQENFQIPLKKVTKNNRKFWFGSLTYNLKTGEKFSIVTDNLNGKILVYDGNGVLLEETKLGNTFLLNGQIELQFVDFITSTGLQIKTDPGIVTVYFSFLLLMISVYVSFFSYSQIWVMESTNQMAVGGKSNRAVLFFQEEFRRIVNAVKNY